MHYPYEIKISKELKITLLAALVVALSACSVKNEHHPEDVRSALEELILSQEKEKAFLLVQKKLKAAQNQQTPRELIIAYFGIGDYYELLYQPDSANLWQKKGLDLAEKQSDSQLSEEVLQKISLIYYGKKSYEKSLLYAEKCVSYCQEQKDSQCVRRITPTLAMCHFWLKKPDNGKKMLEDCILWAEKNGDTVLLSQAYLNLGIHERLSGNLTKSIENLTKALPLLERLNDRQRIMTCCLSLTALSSQLGYNEKSVLFAQKGIKVARIVGDKAFLQKFHINMGNVFMRLDKLDEADKEYLIAGMLADSLKMSDLTYYSNIAMAALYMKRTDYTKALENYEKAATAATQMTAPSSLAIALLGKGCAYYELEEYVHAEDYVKQAIAHTQRDKDLYHENQSKITLTAIYIKTKKYKEAKILGEEVWEYAVKATDLQQQKDASNYLFEVHKKMGNTAEALRYHEQLLSLKDSILNHEKAIEIGRSKAAIDFEKERFISETEINLLNKEIALKNQRRNLLLSLVGLFLLSSLSLAYAVWNIRKQKRKLELLHIKTQRLNENLEKMVQQRTHELKQSHERTLEILQMNSHEIRNHVARILGLTILYKNKLADLDFIMSNIDHSAEALDKSVHEINRNLYDNNE